MPRNVEIKAKVVSVDVLASRVAAMADSGPIEIVQDDTFFTCPAGRLKLREFADGRGELIFYCRADQAGPKESFYLRTPTADPSGLREALSAAHGTIGRVQKRRTLFLVGRTRVHLDQVLHLGDFLELEVVLGESESAGAGVRKAHDLMAQLGIESSQLVEGSYLDLLRRD